MARLADLYVSGRIDKSDALENTTQDNSAATEELSASTALRRKPSVVVYRQCTTCNSRKPMLDVFQVLCGDYYCQKCLCTLFELSTIDETSFLS